jgi:L-asparaginase
MVNQVQPKLIIHGGAGTSLHGQNIVDSVRQSLHSIVEEVYQLLIQGGTAMDAVIKGCQLLEDEPRFNAGTGSVLQSDGQIRMSASLMEGSEQRFSGIINVCRIKNPSQLALRLQKETDRVLSDHGATEFLRELQMPTHDPLTEIRLQEWIQERRAQFHLHRAMGVVAEPEIAIPIMPQESRRGTIGVVALDCHGNLVAGTSTGGKGLERIGRVSDSAMPAGNYANGRAAISCTGIGEDIIDECLAARIVVRVTDGMSLKEAFDRSFAECDDRKRDLGAIGIDSSGSIAWGKTSEVILSAFHDGDHIGDSLEMDKGTQVIVV